MMSNLSSLSSGAQQIKVEDTASSTASSSLQEYTVRLPISSADRVYSVMQFNNTLNVDLSSWSHVRMVREGGGAGTSSSGAGDQTDETTPRFGAGSEYGKHIRDEARRKRYSRLEYSSRAQTDTRGGSGSAWHLKVGSGRAARRYRGVCNAGISDNTAYYVFTQAKDGAFEAFPIDEWYSFQQVQRYRALSADEAEEKFMRRDKIMNYFTVMMGKRLQSEDVDDEGDDVLFPSSSSGVRKKTLKISDLDDTWDHNSSSDSNNSESELLDGGSQQNRARGKLNNKRDAKNKIKNEVKEEAFEDSDDGDDEGRERDYISDSSDASNESHTGTHGIDQDMAIKRLLMDTDSDESQENVNSASDSEPTSADPSHSTHAAGASETTQAESKMAELSDEEPDSAWSGVRAAKAGSQSNARDSAGDRKRTKRRRNQDEGSLTDSSESRTSGTEESGAVCASSSPNRPVKLSKTVAQNVLSKCAKQNQSGSSVLSKRQKLDVSAAGESGITEEGIRRYLARKPMTTAELLQKFNTKKTGLPSERIVSIIVQTLQRIKPIQKTVKGRLYLSLRQ